MSDRKPFLPAMQRDLSVEQRIRLAALGNASRFCAGRGEDDEDEVLKVAELFAAYIETGKVQH